MLQEKIKKMEQECVKLDKDIAEGLKWVSANVPAENRKAVVYNLKKYRRYSNRFRLALGKRPVVAIFGESQVGKSYLVSNLAVKPGDDSLTITDPSSGNKIDFIQEMNPKGGGAEATGLVSRFTVVNNYKEGAAPFVMKLLSLSDIVKIIANGYLSDIMLYQYKINIEEVQKKVQQARSKISPSEQPGFSEDDVYEVKEYLYANFKDHFIIRDLSNINFWEDLANIIPYLNNEYRWELFELLWGKHEFFTDLFNKVAAALKSLGFVHEVRCNKEALTPQEKTILDVTRLKELYDDEAADDMIDVFTPGGNSQKVNKSIMSAITAEVVLMLPKETGEDPTRKFLKEADILDFPGARSRKKIPEVTFIQNIQKDKLEVFLRGKIAFLFDRYTYENEISTLLYCMHEKQSEVQDIPRLIHEWIKTMHGGSQEEREQSENKYKSILPDAKLERIIPLLTVLTKFNIELTGSTSDVVGDPSSHDEKWTARLQKNFNNFMAMNVEDKWPNEWSMAEPFFKNMFMLRDPKYSKSIYEGIDENNKGQEKSIKKDYIQRMEDMKKSFLAHPAVKKHIRNPEEAWQETTEPGKSGVDYIVKHLNPTCDPRLKFERIKIFIKNLALSIHKELDEYYEGEDIGEKLKKANLNAAQVFLFMNKWNTERNAFGFLLDKLTLNEDEAWKVYWDLQNSAVTDGKAPVAAKSDNEDMLITIKETFGSFGIEFDDKRSVDENIEELEKFLGITKEELTEMLKNNGIDLENITEDQQEKIKSRSEIFAENLIANWISKISQLKDQDSLQSIGLTKEVAEHLIKETINSKDRVGLIRILVNATNQEIQNFSYSNNFDIVAHISSTILNDFVKSLGWKFVDEKSNDNYPKIKDRPVFSAEPIVTPAKTDLDMNIKYPGIDLFSQWLIGLKDSFKANVLFQSNVKNAENAIANQQLGEILTKVKESIGVIG